MKKGSCNQIFFTFRVHLTLVKDLKVEITTRYPGIIYGENSHTDTHMLGTFLPHRIDVESKIFNFVPDKLNMMSSVGDYTATMRLISLQKTEKMTEE